VNPLGFYHKESGGAAFLHGSAKTVSCQRLAYWLGRYRPARRNGMSVTHADQVNADLLASLKA
jgi:hypothetical protein